MFRINVLSLQCFAKMDNGFGAVRWRKKATLLVARCYRQFPLQFRTVAVLRDSICHTSLFIISSRIRNGFHERARKK